MLAEPVLCHIGCVPLCLCAPSVGRLNYFAGNRGDYVRPSL